MISSPSNQELSLHPWHKVELVLSARAVPAPRYCAVYGSQGTAVERRVSALETSGSRLFLYADDVVLEESSGHDLAVCGSVVHW